MNPRALWSGITIIGLAFFCGLGGFVFLGLGRPDPAFTITTRNETGDVVIMEERRVAEGREVSWLSPITLPPGESAKVRYFYDQNVPGSTYLLRARSPAGTAEKRFLIDEFEEIVADGDEIRIRGRNGRLELVRFRKGS